MKRPLAIVLTVAIFAATAVCFLRPAPNAVGGGRMYTPFSLSDGEALELSGSGSGLIEVRYVGQEAYKPCRAVFNMRSVTDGSTYYIHGVNTVENGNVIERIPESIATLEYLKGGKWETVSDSPAFGVGFTNNLYGVDPAHLFDAGGNLINLSLPAEVYGRFRVTLAFREYFYTKESRIKAGTTGELYFATFEFEVEKPRGWGDVKLVDAEVYTTSDTSELAWTIGLVTEFDARELSLDEQSVCMTDHAGGKIAASYVHMQGENAGYYAGFAPRKDTDGDPYAVLFLRFPYDEFNRSETYTLNAELYDGSGERYTLNLRFSFNK